MDQRVPQDPSWERVSRTHFHIWGISVGWFWLPNRMMRTSNSQEAVPETLFDSIFACAIKDANYDGSST
jgi:hypothetical protein